MSTEPDPRPNRETPIGRVIRDVRRAIRDEPPLGEFRDLTAVLPPGPYRVEWPAEQGGLFKVYGRQGTPPDFADGWAIPLVAAGTQSVMEWLADHLNTEVFR